MRPLNRKPDFSLGRNYLLCEFEQAESTNVKKKKKKTNKQKRKQKRNTILDSSWPRALRITPVHLRHWRTKLERHK